ncbi:MAG: hypothetical protein AAGL98_02060 [Planctomycetota bacterium]
MPPKAEGSHPSAAAAINQPDTLHFINAPAASPPPSTKPRGLMTPSPDDTVVRWSGRLEMRPLAEPDPELLTADDAVFRLHGGDQPARIDTANNERITADVVGYRTAGRQLFAEASAEHRLSIQTPDLGELSAATLAINQDAGDGRLVGPGRLLTENDELDVTFRDRLDLAFASDADGQLDMIESATFRGDVHAQTTSADPEKSLNLRGETLALTLIRNADGNPQPSQLQAAADPGQLVTAVQGENTTFQAEQLDVDLAPAQGSATSVPVATTETTPETAAEISGENSGGAGGESDLEITRLRAFRQVRVERPDEQLTLTAHALDADPRTNRLSLFGENERHYATLTRGEDTLAGVHLILLESEQSADALGPGRFSARTDENDPAARLNVRWSESMAFNNARGTARFVGRVESASTSATDDTSLSAHRLALEFVPQDFDTATQGSGASVPVSEPPNPQAPSSNPTILDLRRVHAEADPEDADTLVNFRAQTFAADDTAQAPLTRITVDSRELLFINQPPNLTNDSPIDDQLTVERLIIPTRGRLLLEDYRSPPPEVASGAANAQGENSDGDAEDAPGPIAFAGRGQTLFDWGKSLNLDLVTNDQRIDGQGDLDVHMAHNPDPARNDPAELVTLQSQVLVADLTETGGLGAYLNGQAPEIQIRNVTATGRVRLKQDTTNLEADHMEYEAAKRSVLFWAEPRRRAQLSLDQTVTTAKGYRWDLDTNEFSAIDPGTNVIPVE